MKRNERAKKPAIGRPPTGKVLAGFKLSPEHLKTIQKLARKEGITKSELVENAIEALARLKEEKPAQNAPRSESSR